MKKRLGELLVLTAGMLWGCMSLLSRPLSESFSAMETTMLRAFFTSIIMGVILLIKGRGVSLFKIRLKDLPLFLGSGIISLLFFNWCYMSSINYNSVSVAVMLLYTSPVWITIFARILFKEKITLVKILALLGAIGGCALLTLTQEVKITWEGLLFGLGSGIGYALYSIFGKVAAKRYKTETTMFYTFLVAFLGGLPFSAVLTIPTRFINAPINIVYILTMVVFITVLPYLFYTKGLERIEAGRAGIIAIVELVVASIVGLIFYNEHLGVFGVIGIVIVIASLVFLELGKNLETKFKHKIGDKKAT